MNHTLRASLLLLFAVLIPAALFAQPTASLHGTVLDPSGAAVPKASVTATGPNNAVKVGETDENGAFALNGLQPGTYTVRVIASGFGLLEKTGVELP